CWTFAVDTGSHHRSSDHWRHQQHGHSCHIEQTTYRCQHARPFASTADRDFLFGGGGLQICVTNSADAVCSRYRAENESPALPADRGFTFAETGGDRLAPTPRKFYGKCAHGHDRSYATPIVLS